MLHQELSRYDDHLGDTFVLEKDGQEEHTPVDIRSKWHISRVPRGGEGVGSKTDKMNWTLKSGGVKLEETNKVNILYISLGWCRRIKGYDLKAF